MTSIFIVQFVRSLEFFPYAPAPHPLPVMDYLLFVEDLEAPFPVIGDVLL